MFPPDIARNYGCIPTGFTSDNMVVMETVGGHKPDAYVAAEPAKPPENHLSVIRVKEDYLACRQKFCLIVN